MPPKIRCSATQKRMLAEYMAQHPHFANGEYNGPLGGANHEAQWEALAHLLREHGPEKSVQAWKTSWRDLKRNARKTNAAANRAKTTTGNCTEIPVVGEDHQLVLAAIGRESSEGVGPEETRIGNLNEVQEPESLDFFGSGHNLGSSTFSEGSENIFFRPSFSTPVTATVTAPVPTPPLSSSTTQTLISATSVLSALPTRSPPPPQPISNTLPALHAHPTLHARPALHTRPFVNRPSLHQLAAIIPRAQNSTQTRNRTAEPASSTANFCRLQEDQNNILRDILQELRRANDLKQQKLDLMREQSLVGNRNGVLENLDDTEILEEEATFM